MVFFYGYDSWNHVDSISISVAIYQPFDVDISDFHKPYMQF